MAETLMQRLKQVEKKGLGIQREASEAARKPTLSALKPKREAPEHIKKFQWKPGQSGNKNGNAHKGAKFSKLLHDVLAETIDDAKGRLTKLQLLARNIVDDALGGNRAAIETILSRLDPAPKYVTRTSPTVTLNMAMIVAEQPKEWSPDKLLEGALSSATDMALSADNIGQDWDDTDEPG